MQNSLLDRTQSSTNPSTDLLGNIKDPAVGYARGNILSNEVDEVRRQKLAYKLIHERFKKNGDQAIYNLTGLIRGFPLHDDDRPSLPSYLHHIARYNNQLETEALRLLNGTPQEHDCFLATRVSSGMLAIMLSILEPGDSVISLVVADTSHPSVSQAVRIAGGKFHETVGIDDFESSLTSTQSPRAVVITTISPSKKHLPQEQTLRAIAAARKCGALVILDDAHMAARISLYGEQPGLKLGADAIVWSLDKHMTGPRSGLVAGKAELIKKIKARALALGVEAQLGQVLAGWRALQAFTPEPIRAAQAAAEKLLDSFNTLANGHAYLAGAGVALPGERLLQIAIERSGKCSKIVPIEATVFAAMRLLETTGGVTISAVGMPGASCTFRLMLYPDGIRMGLPTMLSAVSKIFDELVEVIDRPEQVRKVLLG